jgi:hypothetical protein
VYRYTEALLRGLLATTPGALPPGEDFVEVAPLDGSAKASGAKVEGLDAAAALLDAAAARLDEAAEEREMSPCSDDGCASGCGSEAKDDDEEGEDDEDDEEEEQVGRRSSGSGGRRSSFGGLTALTSAAASAEADDANANGSFAAEEAMDSAAMDVATTMDAVTTDDDSETDGEHDDEETDDEYDNECDNDDGDGDSLYGGDDDAAAYLPTTTTCTTDDFLGSQPLDSGASDCFDVEDLLGMGKQSEQGGCPTDQYVHPTASPSLQQLQPYPSDTTVAAAAAAAEAAAQEIGRLEQERLDKLCALGKQLEMFSGNLSEVVQGAEAQREMTTHLDALRRLMEKQYDASVQGFGGGDFLVGDASGEGGAASN